MHSNRTRYTARFALIALASLAAPACGSASGDLGEDFVDDTNEAVRGVPQSPASLHASAESASQIQLSWKDRSDNEKGFIIERRLGLSGAFSEVARTSANSVLFTDEGLEALTKYSYKVRAYNDAGKSGGPIDVAATLAAEEKPTENDLETGADAPPAAEDAIASPVALAASQSTQYVEGDATFHDAGDVDCFRVSKAAGQRLEYTIAYNPSEWTWPTGIPSSFYTGHDLCRFADGTVHCFSGGTTIVGPVVDLDPTMRVGSTGLIDAGYPAGDYAICTSNVYKDGFGADGYGPYQVGFRFAPGDF